jgi:integrase
VGKREATTRERGTGRIFQPRDPQHPDRTLQVWWIDYSVGGRRYRESSKSRKRTDAAKLLKERLGLNPQQAAARAQRLTFEDLEAGIVGEYKREQRRSVGRLQAGFNNLREFFAGWTARDITTEALQKYADERLEKAAPATVKYELAVLRHAMKGRLTPRPDFPSIGVHNARIGFFEAAEFEAVVKELPAPLKRIAIVAYCTGWRKNEILGLTWARIDFDHGTLRLDPTSTKAGTSTKNNEGRTFPFGELPALAEALKAQRMYTEQVQHKIGAVVALVRHREDGSRICKIDEAWRAACKRAGYPGRLFHDFRRTAVRNLVRAGVPQHWAMELCGHKTPEVFRRYAITSETDLKEAVARLANLPIEARSSVLPLKAVEA